VTVTVLMLLPGSGAFLLLLAAYLLARREMARLVRVEPRPLEGSLVVIVPARNEEARLGPTLDALLADDASGLRVCVYDDRSTDRTADVVIARATRDPRLTLVRGDEEPPPGCFGKPVGLQRALAAVRANGNSERVLVVDADVILQVGALGGLVAAQAAAGAHGVSGFPRFACRSVVEELFVPAFAGLAASMYPPSRVHDPKKKTAFMNGQVMLLDTKALDAVGGFQAVAGSVVEDISLARALKGGGFCLLFCDLRAVAHTRMYTSWSEIAEGFGKNAVAIFGGPVAVALHAMAALALSLGGPVGALLAATTSRAPLVLVSLGLWLAIIVVQAASRGLIGVRRWPAPLAPFIYAGVAFVLVRAALTPMVTWKGRRYRRR
jgi:cellulose synthase/poly-beta-1,6-N-acetylglucosamine synthase-like glycosyltransferase